MIIYSYRTLYTIAFQRRRAVKETSKQTNKSDYYTIPAHNQHTVQSSYEVIDNAQSIEQVTASGQARSNAAALRL
jgi:hypothetical protein